MERFSKNRQALLECIQNTNSHPNAGWIYEQLKPNHPSLSLGTIYRNLNQLKEAGLIRSVGIIAGEERFDARIMPHTHAICRVCGSIFDLEESDAFLQAIAEANHASGFRLDELQFTGLCPACTASENE